MKKSILSALYFAFVLNLSAQNIEVDFKPKDSAVVIDSIQATNLSTSQTVAIKGDKKLTLIKMTTGTSNLPFTNNQSVVFPNPCNGNATISFFTEKSEKVTIRLVNSSGLQLSALAQNLEPGQHHFVVKLSSAGLFLVSVQKQYETLNFKLISHGNEFQNTIIQYNYSNDLSNEKEYTMLLKNAIISNSLNYKDGDIVMYTLFSGKNKTVMTDKPLNSKTLEVDFYACIDNDGRSYKTVKIGQQIWMAENLAYLPFTTPITKSSYSEPCYYVYNLNEYGVFYNLIAAMKSCPEGWHLPLRGDWLKLSNYLGLFCGIKMKVTSGWKTSNYVGSNESGFSGLPGGHLATSMPKENPKLGVFYGEGVYSSWWEGGSDPNNIGYSGSSFCLTYSSFNLGLANAFPYEGHHVRCIKN